MIHALIDTTRVVGSLELDGVVHELCAEAVADHERGGDLLTVRLRAFLRAAEPGHLGEQASPPWLPAPQTVTEHVPIEDARGLVDEVFASWCHKVAASKP